MKRLVTILKIIAVCAAAVLIIIFSENTAKNIEKSINICISCIIPSMFALMAISDYIITRGYYITIFKPFYFILHRLIKLDRRTLAIFLISLVGGFPIGIKLLREQTAQNKSYYEIAEKAAVFCYCISPTFAINMIGLGVYGSVQAGVIIYVSNVISCFIMAIIYSRFFPAGGKETVSKSNGSIINSIDSASRALFTVCTVLIAFNVLLEVSRSLLSIFSVNIPPAVLGIFEISNLLDMKGAPISILPLSAAISAFGGVCVLMQCLALCSGSFSLNRFLIGRGIGAVLSAAICSLLLCVFDISLPASGGMEYSYKFSPNGGIWVLLVLMAVIFFGKNKKIFKKG